MPVPSLEGGLSRDSTSPRFWLPCITCSRDRCSEAAPWLFLLPPAARLPVLPPLLLPLLPALVLPPLLLSVGEAGCSTASTCASAWLPSRTRG